ncbi:hypothetical protein [Peribacillus frigoritolerans]|uniref:hypothetical protein n=1 Tax=Peribacillus frigoritolerans TaxID=450367 RepID=UPI002E24B960|nr:hypothetical protein [Peribacillus frigoritolerans]MED3847489.1 hypothetical protein [Peribacillus frigoritolerans]
MGFLKNVVTFGASVRIDSKVEEFEDLQYEYESLYQRMESKRESVNKTLEKVVEIKVKSVNSLNKINKISKNLKGKDREFVYRSLGKDLETVDFSQIESTLKAAQIATNATKGISSGIGTALGTWALVSTFGTASTGTAIAGLSGAAATNATLAWLGGGAVAAGGGGIAAGTAILGGLVVIPALALTGFFSHVQANKKIKDIEKQMNKVIKAIDQIHSNILQLDLINERSEELIISLDKAIDIFNLEFKRAYKEIYKIPILSKSLKWTRKNILRRKYFSKKDFENISYIGRIASDFAILIDTKVFED